MIAVARTLLARLDAQPLALALLLCRLGVAAIFWRSGQTKADGFTILESTYDLFRYEYQVPLLPPDVAAVMATVAEHVLPILLAIGLAGRLSAAGLLTMTAVIQVFVYPNAWPDHLLWGSVLMLILLRGPGPLSLDHLVRRAQA
ncbi:DoxX family protein [Caenispirillum bisanense]|uniref:Putative oxidoreductase n=1 Tax=Caenispirillum bisanense TaxID=414052 RepID=A0A286GGB4_9PROT|nr:DoxX family protein [Caenispirillum bisanense]SOD94561.1 putative oxidoreductase [Caenispirillum bisanense]